MTSHPAYIRCYFDVASLMANFYANNKLFCRKYHFVYNISLGSGLGFISLFSLDLCSDDREGSLLDDTTDADDTREFGRLWKKKHNRF